MTAEASQLFTREGIEYKGTFQTNSKGSPFFNRQERCGRCGGAGGAEQWRFTGWKCYQCGGDGKGNISVNKLYTTEQLNKLNATRDKAHAKKAAICAAIEATKETERLARLDAFVLEHKELFDKVRSVCPIDSFAHSILETALKNARLSDAQRDAMLKSISEIERKAQTAYIGIVGERREFTGELITVYALPKYNKFYATSYLQVVRTAQGTVKYIGSSNLGSKGDTITFKANITGHEDYNGEKQTVVGRPKIS